MPGRCGRSGCSASNVRATRNGSAGDGHYFSTPVMTMPAGEEPLEDQEQDDRDDHRHDRAGLDVGRVPVVDAVEVREADRERLELGLRREVDQRPEEVVPRVDEVEDRDRDDHRPGLRQDDRDQRPERAGPVDRGRLVHLARDRQQVLAQQEHVVGVGEERRDEQRQPGPDPAELDEDRVGRDERHRGRQEDRRDQQREQQRSGRGTGTGRSRTRRACTTATVPIMPIRASAIVLNSSRGIVDLVPDVGVVRPLRRERPRRGQRPPRASHMIRPGGGVRRVDELALLRPFLTSASSRVRAVDRDVVDVVGLALVVERRGDGRVLRRVGLADLLRAS